MAEGMIQRKVDGRLYEFSIFGAKHALRTLTKLSKIIGEPLTLAFTAMGVSDPENKGKSMFDRKIDGKMLGEAVKALTGRMDENEVLDLIEELCGEENCMCDGKKIIFDKHYEGKLGHLFKVIGTALEVQYGDFLEEMFEKAASGKASTTQARRQ